MPDVSVDRLRPMAAAVRNQAQFVLGQLGFAHSGGRLTRDASQYWSGTPDDRLLNDSHCREGSKFEDTALWTAMGQEHLQLFQRLRRTTVEPAPLKRIVDWGCGGGANAVCFAPLAQEFIGVDVVAETVDECARQVALACSTPFVKVVADIARPDERPGRFPGLATCSCACTSLSSSPRRLTGCGSCASPMTCSHQAPGVRANQVRHRIMAYPVEAAQLPLVRSRRYLPYRRVLDRHGQNRLPPEAVALVPENELDERYAYCLCRSLGEGSH